MSPDVESLRAFAQRDHRTVLMARREYWVHRFRKEGWQATWWAAQELLAYARRVRPDFPTARDRELDFANHLTLKQRIDRAAHAFTRR